MLTSVPIRYGLAFLGVAAAMLLRIELEAWLGFSLPPFVTFYPIVMVIAIVAGFWPGVLATALASLAADYWIIPPIGHFSINLPADQARLTIFIFLGLFVSLISELHRRRSNKASAHIEVELRNRQEALLESEKRFQTMVNAMPQLGWIANPDGYITWYNKRWYEYTGTTPDQMEGWGWQVVHDVVELPKVLERWKTSIATGNAFEMTFPLRGSDGSFRQFLTRGFPLKDANGCVVQWFGTNTDVEEQARAEKLIKESEKDYRNLFDNMLDGYAQCRILLEQGVPHDFIYLNVNKQFEKLTGLKNVIGKKVSEVIPGIRNSNPELFEIYGRVALTGKPEQFETYLETLNIWFSITVYSNKKEEFVAVFQDVTEHKRTEQEMIVLNNLLTQEVDKRTAELSALSIHVQEVAEKERANLARELHDELGSNMAAAIMNLDRLKQNYSDSKLLQELTSLKDLLKGTTESMRSVVSQLYPTGLDSQGIIPAIEWLVQSYEKHTGIEVELLLPKENILIEQSVELAAYRITQECLTNIAKHAEASIVHIEVKTVNGFLDLLIQDNGIGLPEDIKTGGHGIFGMIERANYLGGEMEISSDAAGTTAHLRLPMSAKKPKNVKRVLIVDDHAILRDAIRQLLSKEADFSVEGEAADGKVALQMAIKEEWDIILLDISLPKMNGIQVLEAIMEGKPKQPIIMLSSSPEAEYGELVRLKGAACYIEKGETHKLVEAMRRATLTD